MNADTALLPLCVALSLVGLLLTVVFWRSRRASRGRILQGLAWTLLPVALYLTGLLRMVWDAVVALISWASRVVFSPAVWTGFTLLALAVVLFVVGSLLVRRSHLRSGTGERPVAGRSTPAVAAGGAPAAPAGRGRSSATAQKPAAAGQPAAKGQPAEDDDMAEIEALLRKRGIE
ncbi:hypothetical protein GC722_13590 [Auraticoccus sp. F435]|uniref:Cellulose synthase n=1 Tax=Auraticoccus cholistanensis TaxID=2656650 RepID=A0A6A9V1G3_9ACTN|nr:hypothetical protein [Auraticoccus cholistanensis]MVA77050.1 hypothetical protein [Auraticoccus cholistanensis]